MLFYDSSFILALFNENDENHKNAKKLLNDYPSILNQKKAINNIVRVLENELIFEVIYPLFLLFEYFIIMP
jgi:predicted nucleic acid-binding protein